MFALGLQTRHVKMEALRWPQLLAVPPGSFFQLAAFLASEEVHTCLNHAFSQYSTLLESFEKLIPDASLSDLQSEFWREKNIKEAR